MKDKISEWLKKWNDLANQSSITLKGILNTFEQRRVPKREIIEEAVRQLREIQQQAEEYIPLSDLLHDILPESLTGSPIDDQISYFLDWYESSTNSIRNSEKLLSDFLHVVGKKEAYDREIRPFREKALEITVYPNGEIEPVLLRQQLGMVENIHFFLEALKLNQDQLSEESKLIDEIIPQKFSSFIAKGIILGMYFINNDTLDNLPVEEKGLETSEEEVGQNEIQSGSEAPFSLPKQKEYDPKENEESEKSPLIEVKHTDESNPEENEPKQPKPEQNPPASQENPSDPSLKSGPTSGLTILHNTHGGFGVKAFKSDLGDALTPYLVFHSIGLLTVCRMEQLIRYLQIHTGNQLAPNVIVKNVEKMVRKGHIMDFLFEGIEEPFYGISSSSREAVFKDTLANRWSEAKVIPIKDRNQLPDLSEKSVEELRHLNNSAEGFIQFLEWVFPEDKGIKFSAGQMLFSKMSSVFMVNKSLWDEKQNSDAILYPEETVTNPLFVEFAKNHSDLDVILTHLVKKEYVKNSESTLSSIRFPNRIYVPEKSTSTVSPLHAKNKDENGEKRESPAEIDHQSLILPVTSQSDPIGNPEEIQLQENNNPLPEGQSVSVRNASDSLCDLLKTDSSDDVISKMGMIIDELILNNQFGESIVLTKALSFIPDDRAKDFGNFQTWLSHATGIILDSPHYTSHFLGELESKSLISCQISEELKNALIEASYFRAVLAPETRFDYGLSAYAKRMAEGSLCGLNSLFFKMGEVLDKLHQGYSRSIMNALKANQDKTGVQESIKKRALDFMSKPNNDIFVGVERFNFECFGNNSVLFQMLSIVNRDDEGKLSEIVSLFERTFGKVEKSSTDLNLLVDSEKVEKYIDKTWHDVRKYEMELRYRARDTAYNNIIRRLEVIQEWVESIFQKNDGINENLPFLQQKRQELLMTMEKTQRELWKRTPSATRSLLINSIQGAYSYLESFGNSDILTNFAPFLQTPYIIIKDGKVQLLHQVQDINGQEPWRLVCKHLCETKLAPEDALKAIDDPNNDVWYNNYGQYEEIENSFFPNSPKNQLSNAKAAAQQWAEKQFSVFRSGVEMAYTYFRIDENQGNRFIQYAESMKQTFFDYDEYGKYRQFLKAIERLIENESNSRKSEFLSRIEKFEKDENMRLAYQNILDSARKWTERGNFSVAEEYLNGLGTGQQFTRIDDVLSLTEKNYHEMFLTLHQEKLQAACKNSSGKMLKNWGSRAVSSLLPREWTSRQIKSSEDLLGNWQSSRTISSDSFPSEKSISSLLSLLGFSVRNAKFLPMLSKKNDVFEVSVTPTKRQKTDYSHPISIFGTNLDEKITIIYIYGNHGSIEILNDLNDLQLHNTAICLIDAPTPTAVRREIAEKIKTQQASLSKPFLLIDQTLILFLATIEESERMLALLQCTLPYNYIQPFANGAGPIPDDMFIGRKHELNLILSNDGPSILYGGRQLGKSALLYRAKSLKHDPEKKVFALYIDARGNKSGSLLKKIVDQFRSEKLITRFPKEEPTFESVFSEIKQSFSVGIISELALYIDEADTFFQDFSKQCSNVLSIFLNLKRETNGHFRFLFAGLHNVMRFGNNMRDNSVLPQLGTPMCISPLSTADAYKLIEMPLTYLGYHLNADQMALILANSLYFPGILHLIGYSIINSTKGLYLGGAYSAINNPPFQINDASLQSIFYQEKINHEIEDKIHITLVLDPRYEKIAEIVAYLYHTEKPTIRDFQGFSLDRIMRFAEVEGIEQIKKLSSNDLSGLLTEMIDMGILHSDPGTQSYRFRKNSFRDIIAATEEKALEKLMSAPVEEDDNDRK